MIVMLHSNWKSLLTTSSKELDGSETNTFLARNGMVFVLVSLQRLGSIVGFTLLLVLGTFLVQTVAAHRGLDKTIKLLSQSVKQRPNDVDLRLRRALVYRKHGEPRRALRDLQWALHLQPGRHEVSLSLAQTYLELKRYKQAAWTIHQYLMCHRPHWMAFVIQAKVLQHHGQWKRAIRSYSLAIAIAPHIDFFVARGRIQEEQKQWAKATKGYREGLRLLGSPGVLQVGLLRSLMGSRKHREALAWVNHVLKGLAVKGDWWLHRARVYDALKRKTLAKLDRLRTLKEADELLAIRRNGWVLLRRARANWALGRFQKALRDWKTVLTLFPQLKSQVPMQLESKKE